MRFPRRKGAEEVVPTPVVVAPTVGKGRPTPKRREAQGARGVRGPVAPPPKTQREAIKRSRTAGKTMTKDERKALAADRRDRMMRGDDAYLLPRDRGPVRAAIRDLVDARRNFAGLLLPIAVLSFFTVLIPVQVVQVYGPSVLLVAILAAVADTVVFSRQISRKVAATFPKGDPTGMSVKGRAVGFYAFNRACLPRRWRVPKARVERGQDMA